MTYHLYIRPLKYLLPVSNMIRNIIMTTFFRDEKTVNQYLTMFFYRIITQRVFIKENFNQLNMKKKTHCFNTRGFLSHIISYWYWLLVVMIRVLIKNFSYRVSQKKLPTCKYGFIDLMNFYTMGTSKLKMKTTHNTAITRIFQNIVNLYTSNRNFE